MGSYCFVCNNGIECERLNYVLTVSAIIQGIRLRQSHAQLSKGIVSALALMTLHAWYYLKHP